MANAKVNGGSVDPNPDRTAAVSQVVTSVTMTTTNSQLSEMTSGQSDQSFVDATMVVDRSTNQLTTTTDVESPARPNETEVEKSVEQIGLFRLSAEAPEFKPAAKSVPVPPTVVTGTSALQPIIPSVGQYSLPPDDVASYRISCPVSLPYPMFGETQSIFSPSSTGADFRQLSINAQSGLPTGHDDFSPGMIHRPFFGMMISPQPIDFLPGPPHHASMMDPLDAASYHMGPVHHATQGASVKYGSYAFPSTTPSLELDHVRVYDHEWTAGGPLATDGHPSNHSQFSHGGPSYHHGSAGFRHLSAESPLGGAGGVGNNGSSYPNTRVVPPRFQQSHNRNKQLSGGGGTQSSGPNSWHYTASTTGPPVATRPEDSRLQKSSGQTTRPTRGGGVAGRRSAHHSQSESIDPIAQKIDELVGDKRIDENEFPSMSNAQAQRLQLGNNSDRRRGRGRGVTHGPTVGGFSAAVAGDQFTGATTSPTEDPKNDHSISPDGSSQSAPVSNRAPAPTDIFTDVDVWGQRNVHMSINEPGFTYSRIVAQGSRNGNDGPPLSLVQDRGGMAPGVVTHSNSSPRSGADSSRATPEASSATASAAVIDAQFSHAVDNYEVPWHPGSRPQRGGRAGYDRGSSAGAAWDHEEAVHGPVDSDGTNDVSTQQGGFAGRGRGFAANAMYRGRGGKRPPDRSLGDFINVREPKPGKGARGGGRGGLTGAKQEPMPAPVDGCDVLLVSNTQLTELDTVEAAAATSKVMSKVALTKKQQLASATTSTGGKKKANQDLLPRGNMLDSSAPSTLHRGKLRTGKKRETTMRKIINREMGDRVPSVADKPTNDVDTPGTTITTIVNSVDNCIHNAKFRDYCDNIVDRDVDVKCSELIRRVKEFQDRLHNTNPEKSKRKKRVICGLNEVAKKLKAEKVKFVIVAPNIQSISSPGGLNSKIDEILLECRNQQVPYAFACTRKDIGTLLKKFRPVSCVAVLNYQGAEDLFNPLMQLVERKRVAYDELLRFKRAEAAPPNLASDPSESREHEETDSGDGDSDSDSEAALEPTTTATQWSDSASSKPTPNGVLVTSSSSSRSPLISAGSGSAERL